MTTATLPAPPKFNRWYKDVSWPRVCPCFPFFRQTERYTGLALLYPRIKKRIPETSWCHAEFSEPTPRRTKRTRKR